MNSSGFVAKDGTRIFTAQELKLERRAVITICYVSGFGFQSMALP
jgi:hypothetical protein